MPNHQTRLTYTPLGNVLVAVQDDEFMNGVQTGYVRFQEDFAGTTLSEGDIRTFLLQNLFDGLNTERCNLGYITGWYKGWFETRVPRPRVTAPLVTSTDAALIGG